MGMQYRLEQLEALEAVFSGGLDMVAPWEDEAAGGPAAVGQAEPAPGNAAEWRQRWRGRGNKPRWASFVIIISIERLLGVPPWNG